MEYPMEKPMLYGYEILGDSNMVRFALQFKLGPPGVKRACRIGLCISGQTVSDLLDELKTHTIHENVLVLIGTNDVLQAYRPGSDESKRSTFNTHRGHLKQLRELLQKRCKKIVFLTVPLVPKLERHHSEYVERVERLNRHISSWNGLPNIQVLPLDEVLSTGPGQPDESLYERFYSSNGRPDGIHLNENGRKVMMEFLEQVLQ